MIISCLQDARGKSCQCSGPHPRAALSSLQESQPFSSMQEHRIQEHETLWGFCGKWQRGRAPFPWRGTHSSANTARLCRALCKASSSRSASHTFPVFTQTTSASKCFRSLQSFPLHCAASEEAQRFQGDYIFFIITPLFSPQRYF